MLTKMGLAAAGTVAVAVLIALTLIPALLGFAGTQGQPAAARRAGAVGDGREQPGSRPGPTWAPAGRASSLRRPVAGAAARRGRPRRRRRPGRLSCELGLPDDGSQPTSTTQRQAYDLLSDGFGPGFNGPLTGRRRRRTATTRKAAADAVDRRDQGPRRTSSPSPRPTFNKAGDTAMITVIPTTGPTSVADRGPGPRHPRPGADVKADTGAEVLVTGTTAMNIDFSQKLNDALLPVPARSSSASPSCC